MHRMGLESQFPELLDVRDPEPGCAELLDPDGDRSRWLEAVPCQSQQVPVGALPLDRPFLGWFCWCLPATLPGPAAQLVLDAVGRGSGQSCSSGLCGGKAGDRPVLLCPGAQREQGLVTARAGAVSGVWLVLGPVGFPAQLRGAGVLRPRPAYLASSRIQTLASSAFKGTRWCQALPGLTLTVCFATLW